VLIVYISTSSDQRQQRLAGAGAKQCVGAIACRYTVVQAALL
jgi:hypothetical protein